MKTPFIIAHRGDSAYAPENTLAAFRAALDKGADGVEFDVQLSRDGVPVVIHDYDLKRTGRTAKRVAELRANELSRIDVGSWFGSSGGAGADFSGETVPTLEKVLNLLEPCPGPIYIELKCEHSDPAPLAAAVCDLIQYSPKLSQMIVKSFRLSAVPIVRCRLPDVQTAALLGPEIMNFLRRRKHLVTIAREFGANQLSLHRSLATRAVCELAAEAGMAVTVWTADNPKWVERCRDRGISSLITNDPARILSVRDRQHRS